MLPMEVVWVWYEQGRVSGPYKAPVHLEKHAQAGNVSAGCEQWPPQLGDHL